MALLAGCEPREVPDQHAHRFVVSDIILMVNNQAPAGIRVSLESDTVERTLGDVASSTSRSFSLPSELYVTSSPLRLKAARTDAPTVRSDPFQVQRGQKVVWTFAGSGAGTVVRY